MSVVCVVIHGSQIIKDQNLRENIPFPQNRRIIRAESMLKA